MDPSASDALRVRWAAERTLLAWVRTSLALFGLGFVLSRLTTAADLANGTALHPLRHIAEAASPALGVAFVVIGSLATAAAAFRYRAFLENARPAGQFSRGSTLSLVMSALVSLLGVLLALSLVAVST